MNIETKFIDNTGMNLVNPFVPVKNVPFVEYMHTLLSNVMLYNSDIVKEISSKVDGDSVFITVRMSKRDGK